MHGTYRNGGIKPARRRARPKAVLRLAVGAFAILFAALAACSGGTSEPTAGVPGTATPRPPPPTPTPDLVEIAGPVLDTALAVPLFEIGDSEHAGVARLTPRGGRTEVFINITRRARDVHRPVQVRTGTCEAPGKVEHVMEDIVNGKSISDIDVDLETLRGGGLVISAFETLDDQAPQIVCGSIPTGEEVFTIALEMMNDSGQTAVATLWPQGDVTVVALSSSSGPRMTPQPLLIHDGDCETVKSVSIPLIDMWDGRSLSRIDYTLSELLDGTLVIGLRKNPVFNDIVNACAVLPNRDQQSDGT